jgi:hypothetical protein
MARKKTTNRDRKLAEAVEQIRKALGLETLEARGRDALDFHDLAVWTIRDAIQIAFNAGYDAGFRDGELLNR